jgi:hypothetical protein
MFSPNNLTQVFLFFVLQLWLIISSQISRVCRHMSDQSGGPLSEEHVCTHTFLMKRDWQGVISISVQPSCLVPYSRSVLTVLFSH